MLKWNWILNCVFRMYNVSIMVNIVVNLIKINVVFIYGSGDVVGSVINGVVFIK